MQVEKTYYVDRHEYDDFVNCIRNINDHFHTELAEKCWVRMSLKLYQKEDIGGTRRV